jgi:hypothetical protein
VKRHADRLFAATLVLLALAAGYESWFRIMAANPSVAVFPALVTALMLAGALGVLGTRSRPGDAADAGGNPKSSPLPGVAWVAGIVAAIFLGGFAIGGSLAVFAYLRIHAGSTWLRALALTLATTASIHAIVWLLDLSLPVGLLRE